MARPAGGDLAIHHGTAGLADAELRPGRLLALEVPAADALRLPRGVALDDYIPDGAHAGVDAAAVAQLRAWRDRRAGELRSDGIDLADVWELELLATCFLPLARLQAALGPAVREHGPRRLVGAGLTPEMLALVAAVAAGLDVDVVGGEPGGSLGALPRAPAPRAVRALAAIGVPARVRGTVVCVPYWHLEPVYARLAAPASAIRPVAYGLALPLGSTADRLRVARRGGWLGHPSRRAKERSRARVARLLDELEASPDRSPDGAVDALALRELRRLAGDTFALAGQARRGFAKPGPRLVVVPFDGPDTMRILLAAAHDAGVRSLLVQHGFDARLNVPDKTVAQHVAVWSERDRADVARKTAADVVVTGNPGADHLAAAAGRRAGSSGRSVVLVEYASRLSTRVGARISGRHVAAALTGLESARPRTTAIIRPHPSDPHPEAYLRLAAAHPGLTVEVDAASRIEQLLATADLCVGSLSTATLQAAALGVPTVHLDVTGSTPPWPFCGGDGLPRADGAEQLADAIAAAIAGPRVSGREAAAEALGARGDAVRRVCELVERLSR